ncbi:MAG TPA: aminotransferase class V-fold PLP-dependent enzyme [Steroidobacteraceae bacterium]|nr:aminotransferase class V-fold PLP-dependent enzyme [Steroidobacteraceae bacterium]
MNSEEFRRFGHELIDWIADYRQKVQRGDFPLLSRATPGALKAQLPASAPQDPEPFEAVVEDLTRLILPACSHFQDPRFFGYFPSNSSPAAVLGDYVSTGLAQLGLNWQASPALTELEEVTTGWLRQMLDLSPAWSGVIQDTASTTTLVALLCARERTTNHGAARGGLQESEKPLVVYASSQSHSSVDKAALLAGFGRNNIHVVPVDDNYSMRPEALAAAIEADRARGLQPCAVVATVGSTATTAVDPLAEIAKVAKASSLWMHVDAAMAGSAMIVPECRPMWRGIEDADSIVINPHKWLGASFDCSVYFVRDPEHLVRVMSTNPSYLRTAADAQVKNFRDWGIPLGRRFRALKLWFLMREQGVSGLQARIRRDLANAKWFAAQVDAARDWKRVAPSPLQTVCVRHEPPGLSGDALDAHTLAWVRRINESGKAYLTPAMLDGRWMVRVSIGAEDTEREHVEQLWALMQEQAAKA